MPRPPKLTSDQKVLLAKWEPILRDSAKSGELETAKRAMANIQKCLRRSGHETRLMSNKVWYFEAAMESGHLSDAERGFIGIRGKVPKRNLTHRKATALLAVCYIRQKRTELAMPLISAALRDKSYSGDQKRRGEVRRELARIFQEESLISDLRGRYRDPLDVDDILARAGQLVQTKHEREIMEYLGNTVPFEARERFLEMLEFTRKELPSADRKLLPSPDVARTSETLGERVLSATKRVVWKSLCDERSAVYEVWCKKGVLAVARMQMLVAAVLTCLMRIDLALASLAISISALILKMGLEVFCSVLPPSWVVNV